MSRNRHQTHSYQTAKVFSPHCAYATSISTQLGSQLMGLTQPGVKKRGTLTGSERQRYRKRVCTWHNFGSEREPHHQRPRKYMCRTDAYDITYMSYLGTSHLLYCKILGPQIFSARTEQKKSDKAEHARKRKGSNSIQEEST